VEILLAAAEAYGNDRAGRMAAAISYRAVFALAPLLIIAVSVVGWVLGSADEARIQILEAVESVAGQEVGRALDGLVGSALDQADTAAVVGIALLVWTGSSLFLQLQGDLNDVFETPQSRVTGPLAVVRARGIGFLWALGFGLVVMVLLLLNGVWRYIGDLLPTDMDTMHRVVTYLSPLISFLVLPVVFGLVFQTMTALTLRWRAVWYGGLFTSAVFVVASFGIGLAFELGFRTPTALGFAGSFVAILFLAYLLSAVFFLGAEVTKVYARRLAEREGVSTGVSTPPSSPHVLVAEPGTSIPQAAVVAFLAGLLVGWRRKRR
jgi:membrane protein